MGNYEEFKDRLHDVLRKMDTSSADIGMGCFNDFLKSYESSLYNEVGKLTRQLHDALTNFNNDEKIYQLTNEEIPNAKERLKYVVDITEKAAQRTIEILEKSIPISLEISEGANDLQTSLANSDRSEIRDATKTFLKGAKDKAGTLHTCLTDIMLAQEYQDISGQIIKKVIDLVQDVESNLVRLIKLTGQANISEVKTSDGIAATGPHVPGVNEQEVHANGQDEVDDLLASLGF